MISDWSINYSHQTYMAIYTRICRYIILLFSNICHSRLSIIIEHICVSCGYDSNFIAHDNTNVNLVGGKKITFGLV